MSIDVFYPPSWFTGHIFGCGLFQIVFVLVHFSRLFTSVQVEADSINLSQTFFVCPQIFCSLISSKNSLDTDHDDYKQVTVTGNPCPDIFPRIS